MHVLRTGSGRVTSGVRGHSQADTPPVPPRRVCALQLHAGTSGSPRERTYRPEVLRCVQQRLGGGETTSPPAEHASNSGLPTNELGEIRGALRSTIQFAGLLQRDVPGPGPTGGAQPPRSSCARCLVMLWACLKRQTSISPARGNGKRLSTELPYTARRVRDLITENAAPVTKPTALHSAPRPRILGGPRRRVEGAPHKMGSRGSRRAGGRYRPSSPSGAGGALTERNGVDD